MRLVRSWPETVPAGRSHVVDELDRLVMSDFDYRALDAIDDDVLLLEWDIAVSREGLETFADRARREPDKVRVAPYRVYMAQSGRTYPPKWVHRRYVTPHRLRHVTEADESCHLFGLGMVYLPRPLVVGFLEWFTFPEALRHPFDDASFSAWHYHHVTQEVPVDWDVTPVHLHYPSVEVR